jgi:hypothetical protein
MGAKSFLLTEDIVSFNIIEGGTLLAPAQTKMMGSSSIEDSERTVCIEGDEEKVLTKNIVLCPYMTPEYTLPGVVRCKIKKLNSSHISGIAACDSNGGFKNILYIGSSPFDVVYTVVVPAIQPPPAGPKPDTKHFYSGKGNFIETGVHTTEED